MRAARFLDPVTGPGPRQPREKATASRKPRAATLAGRRRRLGRVVAMVLASAALTAEAAPPRHSADTAGTNTGLGPPPPLLVRSSPAATWRALFTLGEAGQFAVAAHLLDLGEVPPADQPTVGSEVAAKLYRLLLALRARPGQLDGEASVLNEAGSRSGMLVAHRFFREGVAGEVVLRRVEDEFAGDEVWLFSRQTVANVPFWYRLVVLRHPLETPPPANAGLGAAPAELRRATPRATVAGFLAAARRGRFADACHYFDLDGIPVEEQAVLGPRLARRLMFVLERRSWFDPETVANEPAGRPQVHVAEDRYLLAAIPAGDGTVELLLARHVDGEGRFVWVFSRETVGAIDTLYAAHGFGWFGDHLPRAFFAATFAGLQLWQWASLALVVAMGYGVARLVGHWIASSLRTLAARTRVSWDDYAVATIDGPLGIVLWAAVIAGGASAIGLTAEASAILKALWKTLLLLGIGWYGFRVLDAIAARLQDQAAAGNGVILAVGPVVQKVGKFLVALLTVMAILDVVGVNVAAALAGVGLGGLALAFAAQKTLENVFGALAIATDRPFKVGDLVQIGDTLGTVEDIGLRSTRLRTLNRTLVAIPNATVVAGTVVNLAARDRMLYRVTIGLVYTTTQMQLLFVLDELRRMLLKDTRLLLEGQRVRFVGFGASSLDVEIFAYVATSDFVTFTAVAQELNLAIMEIVERSGSAFAYPSQTLYLARDHGTSRERAAEVAAVVAARRARGELAVPDPEPDLLEAARRARHVDEPPSI